MDMGDI